VNGEEVITSSDTGLRKGRAGLCKFRDTEPDFKDFRVSSDSIPGNPVADAVGVNVITFFARDAAGNTTTKSITVTKP
jgi:hypothetical protein